MSSDETLVSVQHLSVDIDRRDGGRTPVLVDVSLSITTGESMGLVGESGSGKSMTTKAIMRMLPDGAHVSGGIEVNEQDLGTLGRAAMVDLRTRYLGMIYQDPRAHINPLHTLGDFLTEGVVAARLMSPAQARDRALELLHDVGITNGAHRLEQYPHQLSGGLLQRIMIVAALMPRPRLLIADEPTTALDVTVQAEVMAIIDDLRAATGVGMLFITHDLDLAAAVTDNVGVMYAGTIVETGRTSVVVEAPRHPYTWALLRSRPSASEVRRLITIPGQPIAAAEAGDGCVFASRCPFATQLCRAERPRLRAADGGEVACHRAEELRTELAIEAA